MNYCREYGLDSARLKWQVKNGTGRNGMDKNGTNEIPLKMAHVLKSTLKNFLKDVFKCFTINTC